MCPLGGLPCTSNAQFVCPYYRVNTAVYGSLPAVDSWEAHYYAKLPTSTQQECKAALATIAALPNATKAALPTGMSSVLTKPEGFTCGDIHSTTSNIPGYGPCFPIYVNTTDVGNRCIPAIPSQIASLAADPALANMTTVANGTTTADLQEQWDQERLTRYVGDASKGWLIILISGVFASVILSLVWMTLLRYLAGVMAWTAVFVANGALIAGAIFCYVRGGLIGKEDVSSTLGADLPDGFAPAEEDEQAWQYVAYGVSGVAFMLLLVTLSMLRQIRVATACMKVASQAVGAMPAVLLFPVVPFLMLLVFLAYWVTVTAFLWSAGETVAVTITAAAGGGANATFDPFAAGVTKTTATAANATFWECHETPGCSYEQRWDQDTQYMMIYHLFGLLWMNQFFIAFGYVVIAGCISHFYWAEGDKRKIPQAPVKDSVKRALTYHLGSIALGSFIVACVQFIRLTLEYIDRKTQQIQEGNVIAKYCMYCVKYCMWYMEKVIKFINRNAFIIVAVKGTSYFTSAYTAMKLVLGNLMRMAAVNTVGDFLIFLGKLAVTAACFFVSIMVSNLDMYTDPAKDTFISSPLVPVFISTVTAGIIANIFFGVYEMAIDTILLSFCEDCNQNDGEAKHAPPLLMSAIGMSKKK